MSVIENPAACLNETNHEEHDEPAPIIKAAPKQVSDILDETPLTSYNKVRSPKQLIKSCDLQTELSSIQAERKVEESSSKDETNISEKTEASHSSRDANISKSLLSEDKLNPSPDKVVSSLATSNLLLLAENMNSDESGDEEYVPGADPEEEADVEVGENAKEVDDKIQRQYTLRGGVKGTVVEEVKEVSHDTSDKKKADDLWSTFKADVALPIKRNAEKIVSAAKETTYDFAGEAVTIREEIKSKRKSFVSSLGFDRGNRKRRRESAPCISRTLSTESDVSSAVPSETTPSETGTSESVPSETGPSEPRGGVKRPRSVSKLGTIVNRLTKRPKMTVLDKSALDWEQYKDNNCITEDVKNEAKSEGYIEKQDFLSRADEKQFELEKEIRLQQQRRRQMMNSKQF